MRSRSWGAIVFVVAAGLCLGRVAEARNPHCAGGIQYLVQAMRDKDKGNTDDYKREISKSVQQLEICSTEDPNDLEALGYLGWAYGEVDSAGPAGRAFAAASQGLEAKGDKKKAEWARTIRDSYWTTTFNDGIAKITSAQTLYPDLGKKPENANEESQKAEATKKFQAAVVSLTKAGLYKPDDPRTLRNLGAAYAFLGEYTRAEAIFREGLKIAPSDSDLVGSMRSVRTNIANSMIDEKKYNEAIAFFSDLIKSEPSNPDLRLGLADAYFKRAQSAEGDARKPDFKAAGDAYAKAGELKPGNADLPFNAALAYQNAGEYTLAEAQWRLALKTRPDDVDAMSALGSTLTELGKFDEAIKILHQAVMKDPKNKVRHRQLGAAYTKAGNNSKATEELMVYLALHNGKPAEGSPAKPGGATPQGKVLASAGSPEQVYPWEADNEKYESWFYWSKNTAYHFKVGQLVQKSDWSAAAIKTESTGAKK